MKTLIVRKESTAPSELEQIPLGSKGMTAISGAEVEN